ncbi:hypothetical protein [Bosea vestrisii]|jgi:hypothetical protein|uniref:Uncharacterized protein n=1 Tax=Bosea vestrisii TaxID=151416 RepID=A0ABW0HEL1_9HYPH|nr:hypothetical protein [Methylobacterium sp.]
MSMELLVGLPAGMTTTGGAIAAEAARLGLTLSFDKGFSLDDVDGFQPGRLAQMQAGIEISVSDRTEVDDLVELFGPNAEGIARVVAFYWGASFVEGAFAYAVAAALISACKGICFDPQEDEQLSLEQTVQAAEGMLSAARKQTAD